MKTLVKMIHTISGRDDDANGVSMYIEGNTYLIGDSLLASFIQDGVVEMVDVEYRETKVNPPVEAAEPKKRGRKPKQ